MDLLGVTLIGFNTETLHKVLFTLALLAGVAAAGSVSGRRAGTGATADAACAVAAAMPGPG